MNKQINNNNKSYLISIRNDKITDYAQLVRKIKISRFQNIKLTF